MPDKAKPTPKEMLALLQKVKSFLKEDRVAQEICKQYDFPIEDLDLVPMRFGDIPVSATTDKGIITLNWKLLEDGDFFKDISYILHELEHHCKQLQQPTQSADDGDYLSNEDEQSAFKRQVQWLDDQFGEHEAEEYVEQVLDHHEETGEEREEKKEILMEKVNWSKNRLAKWADLFFKLADKTSDLKNKHPDFADEIQFLSDADPTNTKKYLAYAVKQLVNKQAPKEEISDVVKLFHKHNHKLENKDINSWNFTELRDKLFQIRGSKSKREEKNQIKTTGASVVYEDDQCKVLLVKDKAAACFYGSGTKWCITMSGENYFENYSDDNVIFFFVLRKDLDQTNIHYKVALVYYRDQNNSITEIQYFDAEDHVIQNISGEAPLKNQDTILGLTHDMAESQPQSSRVQFFNDKISFEEIDEETKNSRSFIQDAIIKKKPIPEQTIRKFYTDTIDLFGKGELDSEALALAFGRLIKYELTPDEIKNEIIEKAKQFWREAEWYDILYDGIKYNQNPKIIEDILDIALQNKQNNSATVLLKAFMSRYDKPDNLVDKIYEEIKEDTFILNNILSDSRSRVPTFIIEKVIADEKISNDQKFGLIIKQMVKANTYEQAFNLIKYLPEIDLTYDQEQYIRRHHGFNYEFAERLINRINDRVGA